MSKNKPRYNEIVFSEEDELKIVDMYINRNMSTVKIAKEYGCGHHRIERVLEEHYVPRTGASRRKYKLNEEYFDSIDTPNKAYILGFLFADGHNGIKKQTVTISLQEEDKEILEAMRREIGSEKPLEYLDYSNKHDFGYTYKNQYRLLMFSKHMCDSLDKLGMHHNKSLILEFPNIDQSLYRHFIRGYFDGDGTIYRSCANKKTPAIVSGLISTNTFCETVKRILNENLHIDCKIYDASNHNGITKALYISKNPTKIFLDWLYEDADLYLQRKYDRYIEYFYNEKVA